MTVRGIDTFHHLGIVTRDLAGMIAAYERLGFVFTPLSFPEFPLSAGGAPERVGVANRHAIFRNGYLEMLGIVDAAKWASISTSQRGPFDIDRPLRRYEGLHVMRYAGHAVERRGDLHILDLGEARLVVVDPVNLSAILPGEAAPVLPYFAGWTVSADVHRTAAYLHSREIPFVNHGGRIIVGARDARGSAVLFEGPRARR